jgi:signal transduction histidine kinase/ligand-binding sensor domain-containing protein
MTWIRICLILLLSAHLLPARPSHFSHIDSRSGLSQNTVTTVIRDHEGLIWLGTQDGLNCCDGYSFHIYRMSKSDTNTICDNYILSLVEDGYGRIWIGTRNGLCYFDKDLGRFQRLYATAADRNYQYNEIRQLVLTGDTVYGYSMTNSGFAISTSGKQPQFISSSGKQAYNGLVLSSNTYGCFINLNGRIYKTLTPFDLQDSVLVSSNVNALPALRCQNNFVYIGSEKTIRIHDCRLGKLAETPEQIITFLGNVNQFCLDASGSFWVASSVGLETYNLFTGKHHLYQNDPSDPFSINAGKIESVALLPDSTLWIGIVGAGVNVLDLKMKAFEVFSLYDNPEIRNTQCWSLTEMNSGFIASGEKGFGWIPKLAQDKSPVWLSKLKEISFPVCTAFDQQNRLWIGTHDQGLFVFDTSDFRLKQIHLKGKYPEANSISHIRVDQQGRIWASSKDGCFLHQPNSSDETFTLVFDGYVFNTSEEESGTGKVWITHTKGLNLYDPANQQMKAYESDRANPFSLTYQMTTAVLHDHTGKIWVATLGGGLNLFDPLHEKFTAITSENGLPNDIVYALSEDNKGRIWMSTDGGIACYDPQNKSVLTFTQEDGLPTNEFIAGSVLCDKAGMIWFGSSRGLIVFDPTIAVPVYSDARPVLTGLKVNHADQFFYGITALWLNPNQQDLSMNFTAVDFRNQHRMVYSYMLDGFDAAWNELPLDIHRAVYTNLPSGDYVFRIRVRLLQNNNWESQMFELPIHIATPFWKQIWFLLSATVIGLLLFVLLIRYFIRRRYQKQIRDMEMQRKIHLERERISRDLHDNIGSQITYLISSLDFVSFRLGKDEPEKNKLILQELSDNARGTMQQLRETIWAINNENLSIFDFEQKIRQYLNQQINSGTKLAFRIQVAETKSCFLQPIQALHLFRIVQESVNNTIKYAEATEISVEFRANDSDFVLLIEDNGCGFDPEQIPEGHYGIGNIRKRAEELNGTAQIKSKIGKGTRIQITVPKK